MDQARQKRDDPDGCEDDGQQAGPVLHGHQAKAENDMNQGVEQEGKSDPASGARKQTLDKVAFRSQGRQFGSQPGSQPYQKREQYAHASAKELIDGDESNADGTNKRLLRIYQQ